MVERVCLSLLLVSYAETPSASGSEERVQQRSAQILAAWSLVGT